MANCLKGHYYDSTCFNYCPSCYPAASTIKPDATIRHDLDWPAERAKIARREAWVEYAAGVSGNGWQCKTAVEAAAEADKFIAEYDKRIAEGKL